MNKLKKSKVLFILIAFMQFSTFTFAGEKAGNGGDVCEKRIKEIRDDIEKWIEDNGHKNLNFRSKDNEHSYRNQMIDAIKTTEYIHCPDVNQKIRNAQKTCTNYIDNSGRKALECDFNRFSSTNESAQYELIHHEFAGIAGLEVSDFEDSDYFYSNQITGFLEDRVVKRLVIRSAQSEQTQIFWSKAEMCLFKRNKPLYCWGNDGTNKPNNSLNNLFINDPADVSSGAAGVCYISSENRQKVICYSAYKTVHHFENPVKQVSVGLSHMCALEIIGKIKCWLSKDKPENDSHSYNLEIDQIIIKPAERLSDVKEIASSDNVLCALLQNNKLKCISRYRNILPDMPVDALRNPRNLTAGEVNTFCIEEDGIPISWGKSNVFSPLEIPLVRDQFFKDPLDFKIGLHHTCVLSKTNQIRCFGQGMSSSMGDSFEERYPSELEIPREIYSGKVLSMAVGSNFTCGIVEFNSVVSSGRETKVVCWSYVWGKKNILGMRYRMKNMYLGLKLAPLDESEWIINSPFGLLNIILDPAKIQNATNWVSAGS